MPNRRRRLRGRGGVFAGYRLRVAGVIVTMKCPSAGNRLQPTVRRSHKPVAGPWPYIQRRDPALGGMDMPLAGQPHSAHGADRRAITRRGGLTSPVSVVPVPRSGVGRRRAWADARWPFAAVVASVSSAGPPLRQLRHCPGKTLVEIAATPPPRGVLVSAGMCRMSGTPVSGRHR